MYNEYSVSNGRITDPGRFEGEQRYAPYFYGVYLDGGADNDDGEVLTFNLGPQDWLLYPELQGCRRVLMFISEQGFVYTLATRQEE